MELSPQQITERLQARDPSLCLPLFRFTVSDNEDLVIWKFNLWARYFFGSKYFKVEDAPFHRKIDRFNLLAYKASIKSFTDIAFRGASKTTRTKLFLAFCIANDTDHFRKYIKVLSKDLTNAKQVVTDIYNMFVDPEMRRFYPEVFAKTDAKREETMGSFTTATGIKMTADTVGTDQRGQVQEASRPDLILFEDIETRKSLRSAVETKAIGDNMEEARTGLSIDGACIYNCNYISERGNVHKLVEKADGVNVVLITRIKDKVTGEPKWGAAYSRETVAQLEKSAEDFGGEYMCDPAASHDVYVDREAVLRQEARNPIKIVNGLKIFYPFNPSHRYGGGMDVAGGVGLDSSTSVFMDFSTFPVRVVGTYHDNTILPNIFGDEIKRQTEFFGKPLVAPENNKFDMAIGRLRQIYDKIFFRTRNQDQAKLRVRVPESEKEYGYNTNSATKPDSDMQFRKAIEDGLVELNDADLIAEAKSYTRDDAMDREVDVRLTTRHFDLWRAAAICWQMKDFAEVWEKPEVFVEKEEETVKYRAIGI